MGEQRQQFRFRLPWLAPQRSPTQPQRPRIPSESPRPQSQPPTTSIPIRRPNQPHSKTSPSLPTTKPTTGIPSSILSSSSLPTTKPLRSSSTTESPKLVSKLTPPPKPTNQITYLSSSTATKPSPPLRTTIESPRPVIQSPSPSRAVGSQKTTTPSNYPPTSVTTKPQSPLRTVESPKSAAPSTSPSSKATPELIKPARSSTSTATKPPPKSPTLSTPSSSLKPPTLSNPISESTSLKSVASSKSPSPSRSASDSLKTTSQRAPTQPTSESRVELGKSQSPINVSSRATSQAQEAQQESAKKVSIASPKTALEKLEATLGGVAQSISSLVKPQNQGGSEPSIFTQPQPSVAQDRTNEIEPRAPLQKNEPKVKITDVTTEKSTPRDDSIGDEGIKGSGLVKGLISEEMPAIPTPLLKGMANKPTPSFKNNSGEHQLSEVKETSYIGKQIMTVGPSQAIEGNTSIPLHEPPKESSTRPTEIKEGISKLVSKLTEGPELGEKQLVVITLTGENKGASMLISSEQAKKEKPIHIHRGYKSDPDESLESSTDEETGTKSKGLDGKSSSPTTAYVNNNVQSVNNSIVVEASITVRNPGVHLLMSQDTSEAVKENGKSKHIEARKAEFTSTRSERLTHEPTVRRRCLRGLFLDSSDSEPENPNKPRRHGCRYSCGGENEEF